MASGRKNKLTGATGEFLVAAELCRRGLIATPFAGNVPHYDVIASRADGTHRTIQVKAVTRGVWQFNGEQFLEISFDGDLQEVRGARPSPVADLLVALVALRESPDEHDRFYILTWDELAAVVAERYRAYLVQHGGRRPRNPQSTHTAVPESALEHGSDRWEILTT